jgi:predicted DsbA family dithiol-disulfide isomerase
MRVEIWSDVVCPWCYLGKRRFERGLTEFPAAGEVEVVYRSFELNPSAPRGVTRPVRDSLSAKYGMTPQQAAEAQRQMEDRAASEGLTFRMADLEAGNTRDAHRLIQHAGRSGCQAQMVERLHHAYFSEGMSVFDPESLVDIAVEVGIGRHEAALVLSGGGYEAEIEADEDLARALGITGVPFFAIDRRYGVSGAQPAEVIASALEQAWSQRSAT